MIVYEFLYCDCIFESADYTVSIHATKKGAYKAMKKHKIEAFYEWYNNRIKYGKKHSATFSTLQSWRVIETTLQD